MKVALDPAMLSGRPVDASFRSSAEAGYGYVELGNRADVIPAFQPVRASPEDLSRIRRTAADCGVTIASVAVIQAWSSPDEDLRSQAVANWREGIFAAVALGCTHINTELSGDPNQTDGCRSAFFRSMEVLLPVFEREGVLAAVEPHPGDFVETTRAAVDVVRAVGSPHLQYLHCVPHSYYLGGTPSEQIEYARGWLDHVHIADTYRPGRTIINPPGLTLRVHQHFDVGRGEIDWPAIVAALRSVSFDGVLTVQVFGWEDRAERSFRLNRAAVERMFAGGER